MNNKYYHNSIINFLKETQETNPTVKKSLISCIEVLVVREKYRVFLETKKLLKYLKRHSNKDFITITNYIASSSSSLVNFDNITSKIDKMVLLRYNIYNIIDWIQNIRNIEPTISLYNEIKTATAYPEGVNGRVDEIFKDFYGGTYKYFSNKEKESGGMDKYEIERSVNEWKAPKFVIKDYVIGTSVNNGDLTINGTIGGRIGDEDDEDEEVVKLQQSHIYAEITQKRLFNLDVLNDYIDILGISGVNKMRVITFWENSVIPFIKRKSKRINNTNKQILFIYSIWLVVKDIKLENIVNELYSSTNEIIDLASLTRENGYNISFWNDFFNENKTNSNIQKHEDREKIEENMKKLLNYLSKKLLPEEAEKIMLDIEKQLPQKPNLNKVKGITYNVLKKKLKMKQSEVNKIFSS